MCDVSGNRDHAWRRRRLLRPRITSRRRLLARKHMAYRCRHAVAAGTAHDRWHPARRGERPVPALLRDRARLGLQGVGADVVRSAGTTARRMTIRLPGLGCGSATNPARLNWLTVPVK